ncbi:hypothetical protein V7O66_13875 [Methanolobus sp. ZRKC3]
MFLVWDVFVDEMRLEGGVMCCWERTISAFFAVYGENEDDEEGSE